MKKTLLSLMVVVGIAFAFSSCKKKEEPKPAPDLGTVTLNKESVALKYDESVVLSVSFSETGLAKDKDYVWENSDNKVVKMENALGGGKKITATRIGTSEITYKATDGTLSAMCKVEVEASTKILGSPIFDTSLDKSTLKSKEPGVFNKSESTEDMLVFDQTPTENVKVTKTIYTFTNDKLTATYLVVENNAKNQEDVSKFINERYEPTLKTKYNITFYDASVLKVYDTGTRIGGFTKNSPLPIGISYDLGVMITNVSSL